MIDPAGVCPECAWPIEKSVAASSGPLGEVGRILHRATAFLLCAAAVRLAFTVAFATFASSSEGSFAAALVFGLNPWPLDAVAFQLHNLATQSPFERVCTGLWVVSLFLQIVGVEMLTRVKPEPKTKDWLRLTARWTSIVGLTLVITELFSSRAGFYIPYYALASVCINALPVFTVTLWGAALAGRVGAERTNITAYFTSLFAGGVYAVVAFGLWSDDVWPAAILCTIAIIQFGVTTWLWFVLWKRTSIGSKP